MTDDQSKGTPNDEPRSDEPRVVIEGRDGRRVTISGPRVGPRVVIGVKGRHGVVGVNASSNASRLVIGMSIAIAGILFFLDNLGLVHTENLFSYWPVVLIAIGVAQLVQTRTWGGYAWSLAFILGGCWILAENVGIISVSLWKLSPLLLVLLGASIAWRAYWTPSAPSTTPDGVASAQPDAFIRATAIMGGVDRASDSAAFEGGDLVAVMGACRLDLRQASITGSEAVIDVLTVMGGVELSIPETWTVDARVLPLMGGVTDRTRRATGQSGTQRLVIRGTAFMGGVEVKN